MHMKKIIFPLFLLLAASLLSGGCKKYLDVNQNPNAAETPPLNGLLANVTYKTGNNVFYVSNYTSYYVQYLASPNAAGATDIYDLVDASKPWDSLYTIMTDLYDMKRFAAAKGLNAYIGVADILLALHLNMTTNLWGNIPYSQAFLGVQNLTPSFDDQKALYDTCLTLLDQGIAALQQSGTAGQMDAGSDFIHGGIPTAWIKTAHVLKARMFNQVSKTAAYDPAKILSELTEGYTSNNDDAQITAYVADVNPNPWGSVAIANAGLDLDGWLSSYFVDAANGLTYGVFDPRLPHITDTTKYGDYRGTPNGKGRIGTGTAHEECYLTEDGWYSTQTSPLQIVTFAEVTFLSAEALFRSGDKPAAYAAYLNGIQAHMKRIGVADTAIQRYITDPAVAVGAANITLPLIMKEKYVACFLSPVTWDDMRRLDYAYKNFILPVGALLSTFIRRMNYPTDELSRNGKNAPAVQLTDHLWWDQ
jgi:hypothetical protein